MAASTIPKSGGPGSSVELSPVTIAVRDKVIEKFADQPLDEMNNSVKNLLTHEEDEQKRLGILAARVYILRQRIANIAGGEQDRVVTSASPKADDLMPPDTNATDGATNDAETSEWTRLRILDDCEVNGVRFPKTVIIDVKSEDAEKLISSGKAELAAEDPAPSTAESAPSNDQTADAETTDSQAGSDRADDNDAVTDAPEVARTTDNYENDSGESDDDPSALSAALEDEPAPKTEAEEPQKPEEEASGAEPEPTSEAILETPSAAEVTAALEALSGNDTEDEATTSTEAKAAEDAVVAEDNIDEAADVAAELEALSATLASEGNEDAKVAAELEAAAVAMAAGPNDPDTSNLPAAGEEKGGNSDDNADKPDGWFEAQQSAEALKRAAEKSDDEEA
ncbi:hypothetical protein OA007_01055 [SAR116 cluster bacterium]|nr:hypothetical protein [SAR116 cluster bacterium]